MTTTLVYDGDCAFCSTSIRVMNRIGLTADVVVPWQQADLPALGLTPQQCQEAVQLVEPRRITAGATAFARLMLLGSLPWRPLGALLLVPPLSWLASLIYRWVAANRNRLPGGTPACAVPQDRP